MSRDYDDRLCTDEKCASFLTDSADPFVCFHYDVNAEAIELWGEVVDGNRKLDDIIQPYKDYLDFEAAEESNYIDFFTDDMEWTGPTVEIEIRMNNEPIKTVVAHPKSGFNMFRFSDAQLYAHGYGEAIQDMANETIE